MRGLAFAYRALPVTHEFSPAPARSQKLRRFFESRHSPFRQHLSITNTTIPLFRNNAILILQPIPTTTPAASAAGRTRNAQAQASLRLRRKAYIKSLEDTVSSLEQCLGLHLSCSSSPSTSEVEEVRGGVVRWKS